MKKLIITLAVVAGLAAPAAYAYTFYQADFLTSISATTNLYRFADPDNKGVTCYIAQRASADPAISCVIIPPAPVIIGTVKAPTK